MTQPRSSSDTWRRWHVPDRINALEQLGIGDDELKVSVWAIKQLQAFVRLAKLCIERRSYDCGAAVGCPDKNDENVYLIFWTYCLRI